MLQYLVSNGASLFLLTREGESPLKIGWEEYQHQQKTGDRASTVLEQCIEYLMGKLMSSITIYMDHKYMYNISSCQYYHIHHSYTYTDVYSSLGEVNGGTVFTLFSRKSTDAEELSFDEGEQLVVIQKGEAEATSGEWWLAKNSTGKTGYIPSNFFGVYQRHSVSL